MSDPKMMSLEEFRELGYLQEVNRCFLHPLGLAIGLRLEEDGTLAFGGIWDYRDDSELSFDAVDTDKVEYVGKQIQDRYEPRISETGYWVQGVNDRG